MVKLRTSGTLLQQTASLLKQQALINEMMGISSLESRVSGLIQPSSALLAAPRRCWSSSSSIIDNPAAAGIASDHTEHRKSAIKTLLESHGSPEAAKFVHSFFQVEDDAKDGDDDDEDLTFLEDDKDAVEVDPLIKELQGLRVNAQRKIIQDILKGKYLDRDPVLSAQLKAIEEYQATSNSLRFRVVHLNRTSSGSKAGRVFSYAATVVCGNGDGALGFGRGSAKDGTRNAIEKAQARALKNIIPVPRYKEHTVTEPLIIWFKKTKMIIQPKTSGKGIMACDIVRDMLKLAGIHDCGVKIHGSRNRQNVVRCLFKAFETMRGHEEILKSGRPHQHDDSKMTNRMGLRIKREVDDPIVVDTLPGKFSGFPREHFSNKAYRKHEKYINHRV
jgi:ribosomal protein S5